MSRCESTVRADGGDRLARTPAAEAGDTSCSPGAAGQQSPEEGQGPAEAGGERAPDEGGRDPRGEIQEDFLEEAALVLTNVEALTVSPGRESPDGG